MIRIALACEGGGGLGHVDSLKMFAEALGGAFTYDAVHHDPRALAALAGVCEDRFLGPAFMPSAARAEGLPPNPDAWSWGNFLQRCGLGNVGSFAPAINWWRTMYRMRRIDAVICDYAPRALIAARMLGIPVVLTGTAYSVPPDGLERFPPFLDRSLEPTVDEAAIVGALNAFCGIRGLPTLGVLPEAFDCDLKMPQGLGFLDPYEGLRTEPL
ncbi:MAG: hypothetical protein ACRCTI_15075, partial [Beijerinckiaceae bacterium]